MKENMASQVRPSKDPDQNKGLRVTDFKLGYVCMIHVLMCKGRLKSWSDPSREGPDDVGGSEIHFVFQIWSYRISKWMAWRVEQYRWVRLGQGREVELNLGGRCKGHIADQNECHEEQNIYAQMCCPILSVGWGWADGCEHQNYTL